MIDTRTPKMKLKDEARAIAKKHTLRQLINLLAKSARESGEARTRADLLGTLKDEPNSLPDVYSIDALKEAVFQKHNFLKSDALVKQTMRNLHERLMGEKVGEIVRIENASEEED